MEQALPGKESMLRVRSAAGPFVGSLPASPHRTRVPVMVMLPLDCVSSDGHFRYAHSEWFRSALVELAASGVAGVAVDVWWGAVERVPARYDWSGYRQLFALIRTLGLRLQAVMSFHACGGNVGDNACVPLPGWVLRVADDDPDIFFCDRPRDVGPGRRNPEYMSLFAETEPDLLRGRSGVQCYRDFMRAFRDEFSDDLGTLIEEIVVGAGPCGELRYPSYPEANGWRFPGVGEFQCYDRRALASLSAAAAAAGHPEWGHSGPSDAGSYNSHPEETPFFQGWQGGWQSPYGQFFLKWYSQALIDHGDRLLSAAATVFNMRPESPNLNGTAADPGGRGGVWLSPKSMDGLPSPLSSVGGRDPGSHPGSHMGSSASLVGMTGGEHGSWGRGSGAPGPTVDPGQGGIESGSGVRSPWQAMTSPWSSVAGPPSPGLMPTALALRRSRTMEALYGGRGVGPTAGDEPASNGGMPLWLGGRSGSVASAAEMAAASRAAMNGETPAPGLGDGTRARLRHQPSFSSLRSCISSTQGEPGAGVSPCANPPEGSAQGPGAAPGAASGARCASAVRRPSSSVGFETGSPCVATIPDPGCSPRGRGVTVSLKIAGVHWFYHTPSHAAELTAGYRGPGVPGTPPYAALMALCARHGAAATLTCVEMCDAQHPPGALCGPEGVLREVREAAAAARVPLGGENALPCFAPTGIDAAAFDRIVRNCAAKGSPLHEWEEAQARGGGAQAAGQGQSGLIQASKPASPAAFRLPAMRSCTFLRLTKEMMQPEAQEQWRKFMAAMAAVEAL